MADERDEEMQRALEWLDKRETEIKADLAGRPEELSRQLKIIASIRAKATGQPRKNLN